MLALLARLRRRYQHGTSYFGPIHSSGSSCRTGTRMAFLSTTVDFWRSICRGISIVPSSGRRSSLARCQRACSKLWDWYRYRCFGTHRSRGSPCQLTALPRFVRSMSARRFYGTMSAMMLAGTTPAPSGHRIGSQGTAHFSTTFFKAIMLLWSRMLCSGALMSGGRSFSRARCGRRPRVLVVLSERMRWLRTKRLGMKCSRSRRRRCAIAMPKSRPGETGTKRTDARATSLIQDDSFHTKSTRRGNGISDRSLSQQIQQAHAGVATRRIVPGKRIACIGPLCRRAGGFLANALATTSPSLCWFDSGPVGPCALSARANGCVAASPPSVFARVPASRRGFMERSTELGWPLISLQLAASGSLNAPARRYCRYQLSSVARHGPHRDDIWVVLSALPAMSAAWRS